MSIYEIDNAILSLFDSESGEMAEDAIQQFEELQMEREQKVENIALYIKDLNARAKAIKEEESALKERRAAAENKIKRLESLLSYALQGSKFETPRVAVTFRKSIKTNIDDVERCMSYLKEFAPDAIRYKEPEISKDAVKKLIKAGTAVPGAELVESVTVGVK